MASPFTADQPFKENNVINESERDSGTPANDEGKLVQLESDGRLHSFFTKNGADLVAGETINGGTLPVPVYQNKTDNELYACDASDTDKYKFIGFAISNSTDSNAVDFQGSGIVNGFSGLSEGEKYFVQDTAGTIGTTPGTQEILVGVAISESELLVQKGSLRASGEGSTGTATGSLVITSGFRPKIIKVTARSSFGGVNGYISTLDLVYSNDSLSAVSSLYNENTDSAGGSEPRLYYDRSTNYMTFSITSITDTGFTISWSETGTFTASSPFIWEAEGEL